MQHFRTSNTIFWGNKWTATKKVAVHFVLLSHKIVVLYRLFVYI